MIQVTRWKIAAVVLATLFGILFTLPNFLTPAQRDAMLGFLPHKTLNLGLDLRGGARLLYEGDTPTLIKARLTALQEDIASNLSRENISAGDPVVIGNTVRVQITDPKQVDAANTALAHLAQPNAGGTIAPFSISRDAQNGIVFTMSEQAGKAEAARAVAQTIEVLRRRIDKAGTKEIAIVRQGSDRFVIEALGVCVLVLFL